MRQFSCAVTQPALPLRSAHPMRRRGEAALSSPRTFARIQSSPQLTGEGKAELARRMKACAPDATLDFLIAMNAKSIDASHQRSPGYSKLASRYRRRSIK